MGEGGSASIFLEKSKQMLFLIGDLEVNDLILAGDVLFLKALGFSKELIDLKVRQEMRCKCLSKETIGVEITILQINLLGRCSFKKTNLFCCLFVLKEGLLSLFHPASQPQYHRP